MSIKRRKTTGSITVEGSTQPPGKEDTSDTGRPTRMNPTPSSYGKTGRGSELVAETEVEQGAGNTERGKRRPQPEPKGSPTELIGPKGDSSKSDVKELPVGWLVVIKGPGRGNVLTIISGSCSIGRKDKLSLDFGDKTISHSKHATVTYVPQGNDKRKFYIHGGGTNLIYVNDDPVLTPRELLPGTEILIGETTLRFVPLCGEQFDWGPDKQVED